MEINLLSGVNPAHVSLIQMPNGTAKTTTLNLIRAAMSGEKVRSFCMVNKFHSRGTFVENLRVDDQGVTIEKLEMNNED